MKINTKIPVFEEEVCISVNNKNDTDQKKSVKSFLEFEGGLNFQDVCVPINIFNNASLSGLECVTRYLKDNLGFRIKDISLLLNRNQKTVWGAYNDSKEKTKENFNTIDKNCLFVPTLIFVDRSLSFLESLVRYLRENLNMKYCKIANLIGKDDRTVWTVYYRAKKKMRINVFEDGA